MREFLDAQPDVAEYVGQITQLLDSWLPRLKNDTRSYVTVAFVCTAGVIVRSISPNASPRTAATKWRPL